MTDMLQQSVTVGDTPGAPNTKIKPQRGTTGTLKADPRREYVAGGGFMWFQNYARSLPWAFDDLTRDFGDDLYERMAYDPQVAAATNILKASIIEEGARLAPAVADADEPGYAQSKRILGSAERMLDDLTTGLDDVLWQMLDCLGYGNKIAEQCYADEATFSGKRRLTLTALKVKPRRSVAFVVDTYWNTLGFIGLIPGIGAPVQTGTILALDQPDRIPNLLPSAKFTSLTFRPRDGDPRGTSIYRPAYNAWWLKMQSWPEYLKYLAQFASASLIGFTPEGAEAMPSLDSEGNVIGTLSTPEEQMMAALQKWRNGAALAFSNGSIVQVVQSQGEGKAFLDAFDLYDRQITKAILTQTLATEEGKHQSRAASSTHQDVLTTIVRQARRSVVRMLSRQVLRPWVAYNYGPRAAERFTPIVSLGQVEQQDFATTATAIAALKTSAYLDPSQFPGVDQLLNLPPRVDTAAPPAVPMPDDAPEQPDDAANDDTADNAFYGV